MYAKHCGCQRWILHKSEVEERKSRVRYMVRKHSQVVTAEAVSCSPNASDYIQGIARGIE